ncbi:MAG TPA: nitrogen regulation protein NR(II) [Woeseiaceae bacterium]|nr:nitrogen regulation protein NR(II) [Woeseiaceae bacterium]
MTSKGAPGNPGKGPDDDDPERSLAFDIVDNLYTSIFVLDRELLILAINPAGESLLGISRQRSRGRSLLQLLGNDRKFSDVLERVLLTGQTFADELKLGPVEVNGDDRVVDCRVSSMRSGGRDLLLVELSDVTRRSRISRENALIVQHGAGRQMIRQLAHEIKNPLGGLRGAAQLLARQLPEEELKEYTSVIISEADRLASLVDTLLGPGGPPDKKPVNIHELLEYVLKLVQPQAGFALRIRREYDPGLPLIDLDRDQMVQAFLNLLQNAATALAGQGEIVVRSRATTNFTIGDVRHRAIASIEIEDDGPGIPPELADSVFYPLVTGRPDGTGLGLPVAQDLVSRHGGLIEFESRPGKTVFFVRLPLKPTGSGEGER